MPCPPGDHLFWPAAAATARRMAARGHPPSYLVGCALCGTTVDLVTASGTTDASPVAAAPTAAPATATGPTRPRHGESREHEAGDADEPGAARTRPVGDRDCEQTDQGDAEDHEHGHG